MWQVILARLKQPSTKLAIAAGVTAISQYGLSWHALPLVLAACGTAVANA